MVYSKTYPEPPHNLFEIMRYMGFKGDDIAVSNMIDECIKELDGKLSYKVCYTEFDITHTNCGIDLSFTETNSAALKKNLKDCDKIVLFAATVGIGIDRLIARYGNISPVKSMIFQAIGAERIESLCDVFEEDIRNSAKENAEYIRPRFSPGYGDFDLSAQKEIFNVLDCQRKIGLTLNDSLIMAPSKSVTAIIGVSKIPAHCKKKSCGSCDKKDCEYRGDK